MLQGIMKKLLTIVLVIYLDPRASCGVEYWAKTYWIDDYDVVSSIQQVTEGGYILAGMTKGINESLLVMRLDVNGSVLWKKTYGSTLVVDSAESIQQTADGGYILAGRHQSDIFISKLFGNGDIAWQKRIWDVSYKGIPYYIQQTAESGYILLTGAVIVKLNSTGDIIWQKAYTDVIPSLFRSLQQTEDGGYVVSGFREIYDDGHVWIDSMWVIKLDGSGNIFWQKQYGACYYHNIAHSIKQTGDGGYIVAGGSRCNSTYIDFLVMKLDSGGNITWQKAYGTYYDDLAFSVQQTSDGGYVVAGYTDTDWNYSDCMILKLDSNGNISWQRTYGAADKSEKAYSIEQTADGGYIVAGQSLYSSGEPRSNLFVLKLNNNGDIPDCNIVENSDVSIYSWSESPQDTTATYQPASFNIDDTQFIPRVDSHVIHTICAWIDVDDDGFPDEEDNCPHDFNPTQEDNYPPQGNEIGDACDCEGDFECDGDCDGTDASTFKLDFGRSAFENPCEGNDPCNGDFDCDGDCDGTDASLFKTDFGRSQFSNPCSACVVGDWCVYE